MLLHGGALRSGFQGSLDLGPHIIHGLVRVDTPDNTLRSVVVKDGHGLQMVTVKAVLEGFCGVISTLHKSVTSLVVFHGLRDDLASGIGLHAFGWSKFDMVRAAGSFVDPSPANAFFEDRVGNFESDDLRDTFTRSGEHFVQSGSLFQSAGETVKDKPVVAVLVSDALLDNVNNDFVGDETSRVHQTFDSAAERGVRSSDFSQHITGGELRNADLIVDLGGLRPFASSWGAKQDHDLTRPVFCVFVRHFLGFLVLYKPTGSATEHSTAGSCNHFGWSFSHGFFFLGKDSHSSGTHCSRGCKPEPELLTRKGACRRSKCSKTTRKHPQ
mmetsp:Transcript_869/g.1700  ORF Transcript_869/g.1700 Transcript_869/m.1700 type:complete len:327 (+) Transcript_869:191-1171(+)